MYIPKIYLEEGWDAQEELIKRYPLATVVTCGEGGLVANHVPFYLHTDESTGKKYLHAHLSKANHQIPALEESDEVLVIFKSDDSYITPSYYPTKKETHKVVPTWDFAAVHCYGKPTILDDSKWVRNQLEDLSSQQESAREEKWGVDETPESYLNLKMKAICGLQVEIGRTECKFKFEQKTPTQDIQGTVDGLVADNKPVVAEYVRRCNHLQ